MWGSVIIPMVTASGCLFCGVRGFCVSVRVPLQLFISCRFQSGICRLSSMGTLLLISHQDQCSCGLVVSCVWVSSRSLSWDGVVWVRYIMCVCDARCMCCVGVISGVFSFFCYVVIGRKDYHVYLSQHAVTSFTLA